MTDQFRLYRRWFYAAALYNAVWGTAVVLFPLALLRIAALDDFRNWLIREAA